MPAPFVIDSNATGLPVWSCDDSGNVVQNGSLTMPALATTGSIVLQTRVSGDAFPRFQIDATGQLSWGSGSAVPDTFLSRSGAHVLLFSDTLLRITRTGVDFAVSARQVGDAVARWSVDSTGRTEWGDGTNATDTNLYRYAASGLATDSAFKLAAAGILLLGVAGDTNLYRNAGAAILTTDNDLAIAVAGKGLQVKEGSNAKMGITAAMVAGTVTVNTTAVTANSRIFLTAQTTGAGPGALRVSARVAGTSFTITSSNAADTSTVAWMLVEPA